MRMIVIIMFIHILFFFGCIGAGLSDYSGQFIDGYELWHTSSTNIHINGENGIYIPTKIASLGWNDTYVLVKREFLDGTGNLSGVFCWYIIDLKQQSLVGPIDNDDIDATIAELGISEIVLHTPAELEKSLY